MCIYVCVKHDKDLIIGIKNGYAGIEAISGSATPGPLC